MNIIPRSRPVKFAALAVYLLAVIFLATSACAPATDAPTKSTAAKSARFVETDNWWSIEIPDNWQAIRIELDGDRTIIKDWATFPRRKSKPTRDLHSTAVTYEFHEGPSCRECAVTDRARVTVTAQPLTDIEVRGTEMSTSLQAAPGIQGFTQRTFVCDGTDCIAIAYVSHGIHVGAELRPAPAQQRLYELRTSVPVQRLEDFKSVFEHALTSFRTETRT